MCPQDNDGYVTRYVATVIDREGMRTLMTAQQGQYTYATVEECQQWIDAVIRNNSVELFTSVWGQQAIGTIEVRPCKCYPGHFDPVGIYFK